MMRDFSSQLAAWIQAACILEATAPKPGNVHPGASFADLTYGDFVKSAAVIAPILSHTADGGVGETIFQAVTATREEVGSNSNLGMILLLAPLARVPAGVALDRGISHVLSGLTVEDARGMYRAIRAAQPGGMGHVAEGDVSREPSGDVLEMMRLAADRDRIAAEYVSGFNITLHFGAAFLAGVENFGQHWESAIVELHLRLMAEYPDTLIARKCGPRVAEESARRARQVLAAGPLDRSPAIQALAELDRWLRADGHRRNPGTSADLVAACLFAAFREGYVVPPSKKGRTGVG